MVSVSAVAVHVSRGMAPARIFLYAFLPLMICRFFLAGVVPEPPGQVAAAGEDGGGQARHSGLPRARRVLPGPPARRRTGPASRLRPLGAHRPRGAALVAVAGLAGISLAPAGNIIMVEVEICIEYNSKYFSFRPPTRATLLPRVPRALRWRSRRRLWPPPRRRCPDWRQP